MQDTTVANIFDNNDRYWAVGRVKKNFFWNTNLASVFLLSPRKSSFYHIGKAAIDFEQAEPCMTEPVTVQDSQHRGGKFWMRVKETPRTFICVTVFSHASVSSSTADIAEPQGQERASPSSSTRESPPKKTRSEKWTAVVNATHVPIVKCL
jgi:hypothetical protein